MVPESQHPRGFAAHQTVEATAALVHPNQRVATHEEAASVGKVRVCVRIRVC